jgi:hypothetical protein
MLELLDYRRRVFELYHQVRAMDDSQAAWQHWRQTRDDLFGKHSQSALSAEQKAAFTGLHYVDYDPTYRVVAPVDYAVEEKIYAGEIGDDGRIAYKRFAQVTFTLPTGTGTLGLFWIMGYGGGLFIPFGDQTNGKTTYGAGRYLYDTIKGADLGTTAAEIVLDFNFAYHPSCAYDVRWVCPLAPAENKLAFAVNAGEQL